MYINFAKLKGGQLEQPRLRLRTLAGKELGPVPFVYGLKFTINYADVSTIEFSTPYQVNGMLNPLYAALTSYKVIYTEDLGIYVLTAPNKEGDGVTETKTITGYSLEQLFQNKNLFLEEGTYNFWNPVDANNTVLGRIAELDPGWHVGYVAPRLIGCYRTFDEYDSDSLSFCYNDAAEKYNCAFVFDVYEKSINVYDANEEANCLPIYLDYDNLVNTVGVQEIADDLTTRLHLYGSDGLTIRDVNPTGKDYIINFDYFLNNGDLDIKVGSSKITLADRVRDWEDQIEAKRMYYAGLASARASLTAQKLMAQADLGELKGQLDTLMAQQSVIIQALALETAASGKASQQSQLNDINAQISEKNGEISEQETKVNAVQTELDSYTASMKAITDTLSYEAFFTAEEQEVLSPYLTEQTIEEETFVATDVETDVSGASSKMSGQITLENSKIQKVDIPEFDKTMYMLAGGTLTIPGSSITAEVVRGTLEMKANSFVLTGYLGSTSYGNRKFSSGLITLSGMYFQFSSDISPKTEDEVLEYTGTRFSFSTTNADSYFTVNMSEFQQYSVAMELYDYGTEILDDMAWPIYEFSISSANFLYHDKFKPFKNKLELGKAVHLSLGSDGLLTAKVIGVELDFDQINDFNLLFSNRYYRKTGVAKWIKEIKNTSRSSRSFNASKYIYNRSADKMTAVDEFMKGQMVAAVNNIVNKENQTVLINGSGINVGGDSKYQIRIVDNMIAMTDDGWKTAKLAIGLFASEETGTQWGVNAELIAGKLIIGNNMVLQNPLVDASGNVTGTMMFQVDSTGAWLYNSRIVLQNDNGLIIVDPEYGIVAGTKLLFDTNGTTVTPEFMDSAGDITYDSDGMPKNANFFLDINTGNAYFRGKLIATSGKIGGYDIEKGYLHSGSGRNYVALNGGTDVYSLYAMWAGAANPASAPFWVKKDGTLHARDGDFSGTLKAAKISGNLGVADRDTGWLIGPGIAVGNVKYNSTGTPTGANFFVDTNGNVNMIGNITWGTNSSPVRVLYARYNISTPTMDYTYYPSSSSYDWHKNLSIAYDYYVSYSYDGGKTWTPAITLQGRDGEDGKDGIDGDDANVTRGNIARALYENSADYYNDGIYSYRVGSRYYIAINASYILAGDIDADNVALTCGYGGFTKGYGSTGISRTYGSMMYGSNGAGNEPYFIVTNTGCRMSASNDIDFFITGGGVYSAEEITIRSDRRLKHSIEYDMEKYEDFFMRLKPTRYKYNHGKGNRFHVGFIAQDVEDALDYSGLSTSDFAGFVKMPVVEVDEKDKIDDFKYSLRYGEFISLNTHMIQKLVREVEQLKSQLEQLKK